MVILLWIVWFAVAELLIFLGHFLLRKKEEKTAVDVIALVLKILCGTGIAVIVMAGPPLLGRLHFFLTAVYVALFGDAAADLLFLFFGRKSEKRFRRKRIAGFVLGFIFCATGTVNMMIVSPENLEFTSDKLKNEYHFVFMSDLHVGGAQPLSITEKTIEAVYALKPDFVVLGGDVTDDYTTKEEAEQVYSLFDKFECPVYLVYGNHDRQSNAKYAYGRQYTVQELEDIITGNGIEILQDEFVTIGDDLVIFGREDASESASRKSAASLLNPDKDAYLVLFNHQPMDAEANVGINADLYFAGHTHVGQYFPLRFIYTLIGIDTYGEFQHGDTTLYVSPGASGWKVPFRTEATCRYEYVTLKPER